MGAIQDLLNEFGNETVRIIQSNMAAAGQNASGQTSAQITSQGSDNKVVVSGPSYVFTLETGRGPGKQPPPGTIPAWIDSKRISLVTPIQNAAFAISRSIGEKGTKLFQEGGRDDIITPAVSDERLNKLSSQVADIEFSKILTVIDGFTDN